MDKLINESKYLSILFENYDRDKKEITKEEIMNLTPSINHNLLFEIYEGRYKFKDEELLELLEIFRFLENNDKQKEIFIIMKHHKYLYFKDKINIFILNKYEKIKLKRNIFLTSIYYNSFDLVKNFFSRKDINEGLILACEKGHLKIFYFLLKCGANIHIYSDYPLKTSSENGHYNIVKILLNNGASLDDGKSLILACEKGHYKIVKLLLKFGANVHIFDDAPLRLSVKKCHKDIIKLLLLNGANVHAKNNYVLKYSFYNNYMTIYELLLEYIEKSDEEKDEEINKKFLIIDDYELMKLVSNKII